LKIDLLNQTHARLLARLAIEERSMTPIDHSLAASTLLDARRARRWLASLPGDCRPKDMDDAYAIQNLVVAELGPVAAWKVGAGGPEAQPACAAIAQTSLFESGVRLPADMFHLVGVEAEIAYRFAADLPPRNVPYSRDEVLAAIGSVHPAIEISDTRFVAWASQDRSSHVADQLNHGALVIGAGVTDWRRIDPDRQRAILTINGAPTADVIGGNPSGDPLRLLHWLANDGSRALGGLRAGVVVTTGSVTGVKFVDAPVLAQADLPGLGSVSVAIG
jgi:2-keto-4-pentenoate hydratase